LKAAGGLGLLFGGRGGLRVVGFGEEEEEENEDDDGEKVVEHSEETGRVDVGGGGEDREEIKDEEDGGVLPEIPLTTEKWEPGFPPRESEQQRATPLRQRLLDFRKPQRPSRPAQQAHRQPRKQK